MKRRTVIFGLVWAFTVNALWVPGGLDTGYILSVLFPAWYLFLLGLVVGGVVEVLALRWPRLWVFVALSPALTYACVAMFGGNTIGLRLALPMVLATGLAVKAATVPRLTGHKSVPNLGRVLLLLSCWTLFRTAACVPYWNDSVQEKASPNGAYIFRVEREPMGSLSSSGPAVHLGPRYAPPTWFSTIVAKSYKMRWEDDHTLVVTHRAWAKIQSDYLDVKTKYPTEPASPTE